MWIGNRPESEKHCNSITTLKIHVNNVLKNKELSKIKIKTPHFTHKTNTLTNNNKRII